MFILATHVNVQPIQEFWTVNELIDLMFFQALIWAGAPFSPALPFLAFVFTVLLIYAKQYQVIHFTRPPLKPAGVASQNRFFQSVMAISLMIGVVPFSVFVRRTCQCGPHAGTARHWDVQSSKFLQVKLTLCCLIYA